MLKFGIVFFLCLLFQTLAFHQEARFTRLPFRFAASAGESQSRINHKIDLDNEKVAHFLTVNPGEKIVACRCWKSGKFPLCDGAHLKHNKETGDNIGPCVVTGGQPNA